MTNIFQNETRNNKLHNIFSYCLKCLLCVFSMEIAPIYGEMTEREAEECLRSVHSELAFSFGSLSEEYPEQVMSMMFLTADDKVLEIGGNIGRNSCVIASILSDSRNLVVMESHPEFASQLCRNRNQNKFAFHIENSAISNVPLIQNYWDTIPSDEVLDGYFRINTLTYDCLKRKYRIPFTVLVADCEGALYYILQDDETVLDDVEMMILENDYKIRDHYEDICSKIMSHGFRLVYNRAGGWGPCYNEFYQVWKKID